MLISYLVAGTLILVMWALCEMAAANPDSRAFSVYAAKAYGPVGWLWWLQLVVVIAAEALGAAGLLATMWAGEDPEGALAADPLPHDHKGCSEVEGTLHKPYDLETLH